MAAENNEFYRKIQKLNNVFISQTQRNTATGVCDLRPVMRSYIRMYDDIEQEWKSVISPPPPAASSVPTTSLTNGPAAIIRKPPSLSTAPIPVAKPPPQPSSDTSFASFMANYKPEVASSSASAGVSKKRSREIGKKDEDYFTSVSAGSFSNAKLAVSESQPAGALVNNNEPAEASSISQPLKPNFGFAAASTEKPSTSVAAVAPSFSFGAVSSTTSTNSKPAFSFGFGGAPTSTSGGGSGMTFGFSNAAAQPTSTAPSFGQSSMFLAPPTLNGVAGGNEEDGEVNDDQPPVVQKTVINEPDSFYSVEVNLYYLNNEKEKCEKGESVLFLKKIDGKTCIVVRGNNSLKPLFLNVPLRKDAFSRIGKKSVRYLCYPNPSLNVPKMDDKALTTFYFTCLTSDAAVELLNSMNSATLNAAV